MPETNEALEAFNREAAKNRARMGAYYEDTAHSRRLLALAARFDRFAAAHDPMLSDETRIERLKLYADMEESYQNSAEVYERLAAGVEAELAAKSDPVSRVIAAMEAPCAA